MKLNRLILSKLIAVLLAALVVGDQDEQTEPGAAGDKLEKVVRTQPQDRAVFHFLLQNHKKLKRTVKMLDNGVETLTESTDPAVVKKLREHVASMYSRVEDGRRIRMWDELFRELFRHAEKIEMKLEKTDNGVKVIETSDDPYVVKLIQAHARVVSGFVERGFKEAQLNHKLPDR